MIAFYIFVLYVIISFLRFMRQKNAHNQELNDKLNRLLLIMEQRAKKDGILTQAATKQEER